MCGEHCTYSVHWTRKLRLRNFI
uniref:Uncharacterized protein n=1 Tax=Anguilla anguilla TaxID=7936 RepID=A0A0E9UDN7_ANGAN